MSFQIIDNATVTEPVSLAEAKAYMMIDADYSSNDNDILLLISSARIRLEQFLNVGLAERDIQVVWNGHLLKLPLVPNTTVNSIKLNEETDTLDPSLYTVSGYQNKQVYINSLSCGNFNYFYPIGGGVIIERGEQSQSNDFYIIDYKTGYAELPSLLKQAILAETDFLYKLRGLPATVNISPNASMLASGYSNNLIL